LQGKEMLLHEVGALMSPP